jgi:hypothetical protein
MRLKDGPRLAAHARKFPAACGVCTAITDGAVVVRARCALRCLCRRVSNTATLFTTGTGWTPTSNPWNIYRRRVGSGSMRTRLPNPLRCTLRRALQYPGHSWRVQIVQPPSRTRGDSQPVVRASFTSIAKPAIMQVPYFATGGRARVPAAHAGLFTAWAGPQLACTAFDSRRQPGLGDSALYGVAESDLRSLLFV